MKMWKDIWKQSKFSLISVIVIFILAVLMLYSRAYRTDQLVTGLGLNVGLSDAGTRWVEEDVLPVLEAGEKETAIYAAAEMESYAETSSNDTYYLIKNIKTLCQQDNLDYFLMDKVALENLVAQDIFMDLSTVFTAEELAALEADLIWAVEAPEEAGAEVDLSARKPVAIRVENLAFFRENALEKELYFAISYNTSRVEACRILWQHLLDWQS